jgi:hypothetical protein
MTSSAPLSGFAVIGPNGLHAILWVCFSTATLFVAARLALRWRQNHKFLADDCWIILAYAAYLIMVVLLALQIRPLWEVLYIYDGRLNLLTKNTPPVARRLIRLLLPMLSMFWTVLWCVKASFLALFYPLVKRFRVQNFLWYCVCVFAGLAYVGCWISSMLSCEAPAHFFTTLCTCLDVLIKQAYSVIYSTAVDVATDLMIMALPLTILPSLQLDRKSKVGLAVVFSLGIFIIATAIARMTQILSIAYYREGVDVDTVSLFVWSIVEASVALIVGSLPPLKGLMVRGVKKHISGKKSSRKFFLHEDSGVYGYGSASSGPMWSVATRQSMPPSEKDRYSPSLGRIFVQTTLETRVETQGERSSSDEAPMVEVYRRPFVESPNHAHTR